jgi:iron complex outermembrane receptor protein
MKPESSIKKFARSPLFLACFTLLAPALHAQVLEEVIVTAQKREQNMQDVPIAVTAFTGEKLAQAGIKDVFDLQATAPSLIVGSSQNSTSTTFGIRGVFTSSQNFGLDSSVGLYADGIYRARQSSMINNLVDIASVEILRGPQGTLFGRNSPSGAVSVFSVKPDHDGSGFVEGTYGEFDLVNVSGAKSFSAIDDVLAFRATGFYMERDGYIDSVQFGDEAVNDRDRSGVRLQALFTPNDDLSVHVIADRSEVDEICCAASTWKNNFEADDVAGKTGSDARLRQLGKPVLDEKNFFDNVSSLNFLPTSTNEDQGLSMQIDWQTDAFLVTSISAYREFESFDRIDADFSAADGLIKINDAEQSSFSQELRISNEYDNFNYVAGLFYFQQDIDLNSSLEVGEELSFLIQDISSLLIAIPGAFPGGTGALDVSAQEHESYAIFGQVDYNLTDSLLLTAGLRWTKEKKDMTNTFIEDASSCNPLVCGGEGFSPGWGFWLFAPLAPRDSLDESIDDDQVTGTVKLTWFMNDSTMFYASYGTGYKAGGINTDRIAEIIEPVFDAETSEAYEIGMKTEFPDQAIRLNVAVHRTDTDELQTVSFQGTGFALDNAGVAETYGLETDVLWQATDSTTLTLAYAYNHAEYADFANGPCWTATSWHTGQPDSRDNGDGSCDRSGGDLSGNPENVLALTGNQEFNLSDNITGFIYGEYVFTDSRMTDLNNDPLKRDDSYALVNLRAGLYFGQWDAELTLWGRNITDEEYVTTIADTVVQDGNLTAYPQEPTTWGITAKKHF